MKLASNVWPDDTTVTFKLEPGDEALVAEDRVRIGIDDPFRGKQSEIVELINMIDGDWQQQTWTVMRGAALTNASTHAADT